VSAAAIFFPALAMVALTIVVWFQMYVRRVAEMKRERIHPQKVATSVQMAARLVDTRAADNFRNLFELPVLFYVALLVLHAIDHVTPMTLVLAWLFVGLRIIHSVIHCGYNRVYHRFYAYFAGGIVLWLLWGAIAVDLLTG
jgi:hypothetical protein